LHQFRVGDQTHVSFRTEDALIMAPGATAHD
jgi:hypothetical protein